MSHLAIVTMAMPSALNVAAFADATARRLNQARLRDLNLPGVESVGLDAPPIGPRPTPSLPPSTNKPARPPPYLPLELLEAILVQRIGNIHRAARKQLAAAKKIYDHASPSHKQYALCTLKDTNKETHTKYMEDLSTTATVALAIVLLNLHAIFKNQPDGATLISGKEHREALRRKLAISFGLAFEHALEKGKLDVAKWWWAWYLDVNANRTAYDKTPVVPAPCPTNDGGNRKEWSR
ncbi:hypothetical protein BCR44DRAFT_1514613 [Catenaria anguillulae PL171]|uniref:Uncharacterized protein n=1 Tax=Catenaria anguillulae PL171 TaxID=765915 RepID=A0A1Y2HGK6_9FUNG|nr:hypothetical protein BCR44DRAFT_1514613 [Catenaria anguillulae PL171]